MTKYRAELMTSVLEHLYKSVERTKAAVVFSVEGFVIASFPVKDEGTAFLNPTSSGQVAAMASNIVSLSDKTLRRLEQGGMNRLLIEGENGALIIVPIDPEASLAVMVEQDAKMGLAFLAARQAADEVRQILQRAEG